MKIKVFECFQLVVSLFKRRERGKSDKPVDQIGIMFRCFAYLDGNKSSIFTLQIFPVLERNRALLPSIALIGIFIDRDKKIDNLLSPSHSL